MQNPADDYRPVPSNIERAAMAMARTTTNKQILLAAMIGYAKDSNEASIEADYNGYIETLDAVILLANKLKAGAHD